MTYRTAKAFLLGAMEAAAPTTTGYGFDAAFHHMPSIAPDRPPSRSRGLLWRWVSGASKEPETPGRDRIIRTVEVRVCYRLIDDRDELDDIIAEDHRTLTRVLWDSAEGDTQNSYGIVEIHDGSAFGLPVTVDWPDDDPQGVVWLAITFGLEIDETT